MFHDREGPMHPDMGPPGHMRPPFPPGPRGMGPNEMPPHGPMHGPLHGPGQGPPRGPMQGPLQGPPGGFPRGPGMPPGMQEPGISKFLLIMIVSFYMIR